MVRFITAIIVVISLLVTPSMMTSDSHNPFALAIAEEQRHADLSAEVFGNGHSHDFGLEEEKQVGHQHGHNPVDHSHEIQLIPPALLNTLGILPQLWNAALFPSKPQGRNFRLERPPKVVLLS